MNAIKELITEHEAVGTTLRTLDRITEDIGTGKHEEFHKLLDHLENVYLK